jgi:hypothetical protein
MKYKIFHHSDNSYDVITEDGGVAAFYHNDECFVTHYYQGRLTDCNPEGSLWDQLSESKVYINDWEGSDEPTEEEVVKDALEWLVFPAPAEGWELDQSIWNEFFPTDVQTPPKQRLMGRLKGKQTTMESWIIANGKAGDHFYSDKKDGGLTAIASYHKRKITTERLIVITTGGKEPKAKYITKVTLN